MHVFSAVFKHYGTTATIALAWRFERMLIKKNYLLIVAPHSDIEQGTWTKKQEHGGQLHLDANVKASSPNVYTCESASDRWYTWSLDVLRVIPTQENENKEDGLSRGRTNYLLRRCSVECDSIFLFFYFLLSRRWLAVPICDCRSTPALSCTRVQCHLSRNEAKMERVRYVHMSCYQMLR